MRKTLTRKEAQEKIDSFFKQKKLDAEYVRKIKRLAMKYNIKLGKYRRRFCRKCFNDLLNRSVRVTKNYKIMSCGNCGERKKWKISYLATSSRESSDAPSDC